MRILYLTGGAGKMYCGSCLRDNAMATELLARGHDVTLLPVYTPTLTDEPNVSRDHVVLGGISTYLEQYVPMFRKTPRWLDRLWDSKLALDLASRRSISTNPKMLGEMTVSVLKGEDGFQRKEIAKLAALPCMVFWVAIMVFIWLFLLGWARIVSGQFSRTEIAMTIAIGVAAIV